MQPDTRKLAFEFFKHLTTLDTACLLLVVTLCDKFFPKPLDIWTVISVVVWLIASLLASLVMMFVLAFEIAEEKSKSRIRDYSIVLCFAVSAVGFLIGLYQIAAYAGRVNGVTIPLLI